MAVAITPRSAWGARAIPGGRDVAPSARRWVVAHWPVMTSRPTHQWMRDIEAIHLRNGWFGFGYNFAVAMNGECIEGAGLRTQGVHEPSRNRDGFGVVYLHPSNAQGVPQGPFTQEARNTGRALYDWLCQQSGRQLDMGVHSQFSSTACPGNDVRNWVRGGMGGAPVGPPPPPPMEGAMAMFTSTLTLMGDL